MFSWMWTLEVDLAIVGQDAISFTTKANRLGMLEKKPSASEVIVNQGPNITTASPDPLLIWGVEGNLFV